MAQFVRPIQYGRVLKELQAIPDIPKTYTTFQEYGKLLNDIGFYFYNLDDVDYKLAINRFKDSFTYFYIHYVENEYFELDLDTLDSESNSWLLQNEFKTEKIKIRTKDKNNDSRNITDKDELIALIKNGYYFYGYENSAYDYDKFDSYPEKQLADYVNHLIEQEPDKEQPFWLRNERNIHFKYGTHKYFPDFIFFYNKIIYVIEIKGEAFSNVKKNRLLLELNNVEGIGKVNSYVGMVVFEVQMKNLKDLTKSFDEFRAEAEEYFNQLQTISEVIIDDEVPAELKYKEYVPAYEAKQAYSKFILHKEPKSLKWIKVKPGDYNATVFSTMVKNDDLGEEFKNKWVLFDNTPLEPEQLESQIILAFHPGIDDDSYKKKGLTIKTFNYKEVTRKIGMFDETIRTIILSNFIDEKIKVEQKLDEFKVIAHKI